MSSTDSELRAQALDQAVRVSNPYESADATTRRADAYYRFLSGQAPAQNSGEPTDD